MTRVRPNKDDKQAELLKYRELVLATIDYYLANIIQIKTADFDSVQHYEGLKRQTEEHFQKGRLTRLKQWFRDFTEMQIETRDLKFSQYLKDKTKYDIDIFKSFFQRVDSIIEKSQITSDNQFYDISMTVDHLCHCEPIDKEKIDVLNKMLVAYEQGKLLKIKRPNTL
jgi:hypothetical protein